MANKENAFKTILFESTIDYPVVHTPNTKFNKQGEYKLNLRLDTPEQVTKFKKLMADNNIPEQILNVEKGEMESRLRSNGDGTYSVSIKRPAVSQKGNTATITVVDAQNNVIPKNVLIGNGSKAIVEMFAYEGMKGKGVLRLSGVQVLDLVPYAAPSNFKKQSSGFNVNTLSSDESTGEEDLANPF